MLEILIMEDDLVDQMAIKRLLGKKFPTAGITCCSNVKETKELLDKQKFDWILTDFNLPDGTVYDILPYAQQTKMICLSGDTDQAKITELKAGGLYQFFIKDQHLNYLEKISNELNESKVSSQRDHLHSGISNYPILQALENNLGKDYDTWLEVIDLIINKSINEAYQNLKIFVQEQDKKQTKFLAHKMQSGYRVINGLEIIKNLKRIEETCISDKVSWEQVHLIMNNLEPIIASTKQDLLICKKHLIKKD